MEGWSDRTLITDIIIKCKNKLNVYCIGILNFILIKPVIQSQYYHSSQELENTFYRHIFIEMCVFQLDENIMVKYKEHIHQEWVKNWNDGLQ